MPITRRQFELEIDTKIEEWMGEISKFLVEHKYEAFSQEELSQHFAPILVERLSDFEKKILKATRTEDPLTISSDEAKAFNLALEKLVEIHAVGKRIIRGTYYYAFIE